jgi:hypothetical protein
MHKQILAAAHKLNRAVHRDALPAMRRRRERSVHGQMVNPGRLREREGQKRHDVGHATGGDRRSARLSQPRRGRLPAATPGNPACRKTRHGPRFDCVSSRWPQQPGTRAPRAGPRASRRPPRSAAATSAPRQSRSGGVTQYRDAGQLPCGVHNGAAPSPSPTSTPRPRAGHRLALPRGRAHGCYRHPALRIAGRELGADPPVASGSGAYTTADKRQIPAGIKGRGTYGHTHSHRADRRAAAAQ